jgi:hypothetical protein
MADSSSSDQVDMMAPESVSAHLSAAHDAFPLEPQVNTCLANLDHEPSEFELKASKLSVKWQSFYGAVVWCKTHDNIPW